jgi:hypothetical protein
MQNIDGIDMELGLAPISNVDNVLVNQAGGARNQGQYLTTYVSQKLTNLFSLDSNTVYSIVENTEYLVISLTLSYIYAKFLDKMFPIKYNFSKEKLSLDVVLHVFALALGFYFIPKAVKVFPSIFHTSIGFKAYQTDAYSGTFVLIFLSLFSFETLNTKLSMLMKKFGVENFNSPVNQSPGINKEKGRVDNDNEVTHKLVDENTRPSTKSSKQQLSQHQNQYPMNSSVPTVSNFNHQQVAGMNLQQQPTRERDDDGSDLRKFLNQVNNQGSPAQPQHQVHQQPTQQFTPLSMGDMGSGGMAPF